MLVGVYGDHIHYNDRTHLDGGVADAALWKRLWKKLSAQLASWYATPPGIVGRRFTVLLSAYLQGVHGISWKSKRPLIFTHVILTKTSGASKAKEICTMISRWLELWEEGQYAGLIGDTKAKGADWEGLVGLGEDND